MKGGKKTIVFDFDGVVHSYRSGWKGAVIIPDPPVAGIKREIDDLRTDCKVVIVSTRCFQPGGIEAIKRWLKENHIEVDDVLGEKPPAYAYVDDRGITFDGNATGLANKVRSFKNWIDIAKESNISND